MWGTANRRSPNLTKKRMKVLRKDTGLFVKKQYLWGNETNNKSVFLKYYLTREQWNLYLRNSRVTRLPRGNASSFPRVLNPAR
jgi:hypothetical protein